MRPVEHIPSDLKATKRLIKFVSFSFLILLIISIGMGYILFIHKFTLLEDLRQQDQVDRIRRIIEAERAHLEGICGDWAVWDESWAFLRDENDDYIDSNLSLETLLTLNLNLMSFVRNDGTIKWQMVTDILNESEVFREEFPQDVFPKRILELISNDSSGGLLSVDNRTYLVVTRAVVESPHSVDSPGFIVLGRELNSAVITSLGEITNINFQIYSLKEESPLFEKEEVEYLLSDRVLIEKNKLQMTSYTRFSSVESPADTVLVRIDQDMDLLRLGRQTFLLYMLFIIGSVLVVVIAVLIFIRNHYLLPVNILIKGVLHIREKGDLAFRIQEYPDNEFGHLCESFNSLLDVIQKQTAELSRHNQDLHEQANTDELTGLYNKRFFHNWQEVRASGSSERQGSPYSFLLLDLDHFKFFNDRYGHIAGDACLRNIARALKSVVTRDTDFCCRYGGEEFLIILEDTDSQGASKVAQMILKKIAELKIPHADSSTGSYVSVSIGVAASTSTNPVESEVLLDLADKALYESKHSGRNRYTIKDF